MKLAASRALWHGHRGSGVAPNAASISVDVDEHVAVREPTLERPDDVCPAVPAGHTLEDCGEVVRAQWGGTSSARSIFLKVATSPTVSARSISMSSSLLPCTFGPV